MIRLITFGGLRLEQEGAPYTRAAIQRRQLVLLAMIAAAGQAGISRDKLVAYFWPEREPDKARNLLDQAFSAARRAFGSAVFLPGPTAVAIDSSVLPSDIAELNAALAAGDTGRAVALYRGPFLDGVFINDAPEFERWLESERGRLARECSAALETLAAQAAKTGDREGAIRYRRRLFELDPLSARAASGLIRALRAAGERAQAVEVARLYETLVREELESEPDTSVAALAASPMPQLQPEWPTADASSESGPSVPPASDRGTTVGRVGEDRATNKVWDGAAGRRPGAEVGGESVVSASSGGTMSGSAPPTPPTTQNALAAVIIAMAIVAAVLLSLLAIRHPSTPAATDVPASDVTGPSLAVLPFLNLSPSRENDFISDGVTEQLITELSKVRGLRVAARTSAFMFRSPGLDVRDVARKLDVATVLEGSVQTAGNRVRINAQLVDARTGYHLWTEQYDRDLRDLFGVQDEIAKSIVIALRPRLGGAAEPVTPPSQIAAPEAYLLYLQGRFAWHQRGAASIRRAIALYRSALAKDSDYVLAYAGLADAYAVLPIYETVRSDSIYDLAESAARHALSLDSSLAEPHAALGLVHIRRYRWDRAVQELRQAIALSPYYSTAHQWLGKALSEQGLLAEGESEIARALALDPLSAVTSYNLAQTLFWQRRYDAAREQNEATLQIDSAFFPAHTLMGYVLVSEGRAAESIPHFQRALELHGDSSADDLASLGYGYAMSGQREKARSLIPLTLAMRQRRGGSAADIGLLSLAVGDEQQAMDWLERALREYDSDLEAFVPSPLLDPLKRNPRYQALRRRMNLE